MERYQVKIIATFGCFIVPFICTLLPVKVNSYFEKKGERGKKILSCLMCFGGGVFFATFMLHMAPEARMIVEYSLAEPNGITYPLADLFMAAGFFLVLFAEKFVMIYNKKGQTKPETENCVQFKNKNECNKNNTPCNPMPLTYEPGLKDIEELGDPNCPLYGSGSCCKDPEELHIQMNATEESGFFGKAKDQHDHLYHEGHLHEEAILEDSHSARSLILLVALSFHRIFEGMSLGLQHTSANVINLYIAVMCHETVIGFSLGLQFVKHKWSVSRMVLACFICSLIMPIGVIIGTLMVELGNTSDVVDIVNGILQSMATGTFIYVTFFEILQEELCADDTSFVKVFSVLFGFIMMALLCLVPESNAEGLTGHDVIATTVFPMINTTLSSTLTSE